MNEMFLAWFATTLEGIGVFILTLHVFRFRLQKHTYTVIIVNVFISFANNYLNDLSSIFNIFVLILCLIFIFKISFIESIIMSFVGLLSLILVQGFIILGVSVLENTNLLQIRETETGYLIQIVSFIFIIIIDRILNKHHFWFTFISFEGGMRFKFNKINTITLASLPIVLVILTLAIRVNNVFLGMIIFLVFFAIMLYLLLKKENRELAYD